MRESWYDDPTAVRFADLSAASAAVVRFRRRRRTTLAAALSLAAVMVVSSRAVRTGSESSLVPTDSPTVTHQSASPAPSASPEPSPAPTPRPGGDAGDGQAAPGAGSARGTVVAPGYTPVTEPGAAARPARAWPPARAAVVRTAKPRSGDHQNCALIPMPGHGTLCAKSQATSDFAGGYVLTYTVCQEQPSFAEVMLEFGTAREMDFAIVADKRIVWQWSTGQRFPPSPHTVTVRTDECVEWRTHWNGLLDDGTRLRPGKYVLRAAARETERRLPPRKFTFQIR